MRKLTINLPDTVDLTPKELVTAVAAQLYQMGKLSIGQAANLAGYSKRTFIELLADYGVSIFNFPTAELDRDIKNVRNYHI